MSNIITDEMHSFEMGVGSKKKKVVGCPDCKTGRVVGINCVGFECRSCMKWIREVDFLSEDKCESYLNQIIPIDKGFTKIKGDAEKKAYEWKDWIKKTGRDNRKHEPK
jgi:hypothetical protein